jgi:ATP phosphoribosyltransferase
VDGAAIFAASFFLSRRPSLGVEFVSAVVDAAESQGVILVPKNRGLVAQASRALAGRGAIAGTISHVRGEDVGALACEAARADRGVFAMTGDDLLDEWLAAGNSLDERLRRSQVAWLDPEAIYGAPALCAIAPSAAVLERKLLRVAVCARYARLAEPYLRELECRGVSLRRTYVQGALETVVAADLADCAIDIVVTGRSLHANGLCVVDLISISNLAVLETL